MASPRPGARALPLSTSGATASVSTPTGFCWTCTRTGSIGACAKLTRWTGTDGTGMRLHFPNKEHADLLTAPGDTSIGAASDNVIVLTVPGIAAHHASLHVGDRGYVLSVIDSAARVHVNARPVREKAILRLGDVVSLDTLQFILKPDRDASIRTDVPAASVTTMRGGDEASIGTRSAPPKAVLRGVSGSYFGKIVPLRGKLTIGRSSDCDLVLDEPEMSKRHAVIENSGD